MRYNGWIINRTKDVPSRYISLARKYLGILKEKRDKLGYDVIFDTKQEADGTIIRTAWAWHRKQ